MSSKEQPPANAPTGSTLDELDHRHIVETESPKKLILIGISALVVAIVVAVVFHNRKESRIAAAQALGSASTTEELQAVADQHSGTVSAGSALIEISNRQINEGRYEEAVATLDTFLSDYNSHPLVDRALVAKASALLRLDRSDDALATLDQFDAKHSDSPLKDIATLLRGDIQKQRGDTEAANAAYTIVASSSDEAGSLAPLAKSRQDFISYTAPREVEPAPKPEPELPANGNLPPASTGNPEIDALINEVTKQNEPAAAEEAAAASDKEAEVEETPAVEETEALEETPAETEESTPDE